MRAPTPVAAAALALTALPALAADTAPLRLEPGAAIGVVCESKSVVVATDAANATNGSFGLRLEVAAASDPKAGRWTIVAADAAHKASLAVMQAKACTGGCPFVAGDADVQLWAPAPKGIDKLAPDEVLMLAVLKTDAMTIKASTFRGQQIEALEAGSCRVASDSEPKSNSTPERAP